MALTESIVEDAAITWFGELGYAVGHGPHMAPGEQAEGTLTPALSQGERASYGDVVLVGRLREGIQRLNPRHMTADKETMGSRTARLVLMMMVELPLSMRFLLSSSTVMTRVPVMMVALLMMTMKWPNI